jgi:hypothetical protein
MRLKTGKAERDRPWGLILIFTKMTKQGKKNLVDMVGIASVLATCVSVYSAIYGGGEIMILPAVVFGIASWFYFEVTK